MNKLTILYFLLLTTLAACQNTPMEEKFDYTGTLSAPYEYPVQVIEGHLISDDYTQSFSGWGIINIEWGHEGGVYVSGPDVKDVPHALDMTWRSFQENKWYTGKFDLPKDKILELFKEGYTDRRTLKKRTYSSVVIGLAPQGNIVVWLSGAGHQVEVATFKAKETQLKKENYSSGNAYMFKEGYVEKTFNRKVTNNTEIKQRIAKRGGLPPMDTYINTYRQKYNWKPAVELPENDKQPHDIGFSMYNGEQEDLKEDYSNKLRAVVKRGGFYWFDRNGKERGVIVEVFNEKEIFEAFSQFSNKDVDLIFEISDNYNVKKISLKSNDKEIELHNVVFEIGKID